jgi:hypothetical protein
MRTARSLGIEILGGRAVALVPEGSSAPCARSRVFTTVTDGQRAVEIRIVTCRGDRALSSPVARFLLAGIRRGPRGEARIEIGLSLEAGGMLRAWAREAAGSAREEVSFSGLPAVYAVDENGSPLHALVDRIRRDWPASAAAGKRAAREIREWLTAPLEGVPGSTGGPASLDCILALQTIAGELACAKRGDAASRTCDEARRVR